MKRQAELFFPPEFADDFPVAMQVSEKYGLVYVITKLGLLFVYDLETATAVYRNRISPDPIFLTANAPETGGFYAINRYSFFLLMSACSCCWAPHCESLCPHARAAVASVRAYASIRAQMCPPVAQWLP